MELERIVGAVNHARIAYLLERLEEQTADWVRRAAQEELLREDSSDRVLDFSDERDVLRAASVVPDASGGARVASYGPPAAGGEFVVAYDSPREDERVTYVVRDSGYERVANYRVPTRNVFYVHVPPWASIRAATDLELGQSVLGTANVATGEIRLLESLDAAEKTEVLLHETMHLLYPMHSEQQIRDLTRDILGKEYCRFH